MKVRFLFILAALSASAFSHGATYTLGSFSHDYSAPAHLAQNHSVGNYSTGNIVTVHTEARVSKALQSELEALVNQTVSALTPYAFSEGDSRVFGSETRSADQYKSQYKSQYRVSPLATLNSTYSHSLPPWLFSAIKRCEHWFTKTEGNISCRNGALFTYWAEYVAGEHELSRKEVRRLARMARVAEVTLKDNHVVSFASPIVWDFADYTPAVLASRVAKALRENGITTFHLNTHNVDLYASATNESWQHIIDSNNVGRTKNVDALSEGSIEAEKPSAKALTIKNGVVVHLRPQHQSAFMSATLKSKEKGIISQSDGWPSAQFESIAIAPNAFDAMALAHLGATKSAQQSLAYVDGDSSKSGRGSIHALRLIDDAGRVFSSSHFSLFTSPSKATADMAYFNISVTLPMFNIADYRGPYVSVWLSDDKNRLIKSLALRGTNDRWLNKLRTWWRRVGRKDEALIDGFAGATQKNKPLQITWDGTNDFGEKVQTKNVILHVEVVREHGGRSYEKIPLLLAGEFSPIDVAGTGEIEAITVNQMFR